MLFTAVEYQSYENCDPKKLRGDPRSWVRQYMTDQFADQYSYENVFCMWSIEAQLQIAELISTDIDV